MTWKNKSVNGQQRVVWGKSGECDFDQFGVQMAILCAFSQAIS